MSNFKRQITPEQLDELTNEQMIKLIAWWIPAEHDAITRFWHKHDSGLSKYREWKFRQLYPYTTPETSVPEKPKNDYPDSAAFPLLDIGQMIQLLQESKLSHCEFDCGDNDLCNRLWEAVKVVLE
jgi:hypothetical protein